MFFFVLNVFSLFLLLSNAEEPNLNPRYPGPCPVSSSVSDYDEKKVLGSWIVAKSSDRNLDTIECINGTVEKSENGLSILYDLYNATGGFSIPINFTLQADKMVPGTFSSTYEMDGATVMSMQTIVTQDDSFMLWVCCSYGKEHREVAFIQAKPGKIPSNDTLNKFNDFLSNHGSSLKNDEFLSLHDINCQIDD